MTLPNFLIIGAAKSGTTSLYHYLQQHPQIYMNGKEPSFFALKDQNIQYSGPGDQEGFIKHAITDLKAYEAIFDGINGQLAWGEASVLYLYSPEAPVRIKHYIPDVKLIAILRNPIDRAFSSYMHLRRDGREPLDDFFEALQAENSRIKANWEHQWHYRSMGCYYSQLKRYYKHFSPEQISIYTYEEFKDDPFNVLKSIIQFLGVNVHFVPDISVKHNISGMPRISMLHTFLIKPNRVKDIFKPLVPLSARRQYGTRLRNWNTNINNKQQISNNTRQYLANFFKDEILNLQDLIGRDLTSWLDIK
jgi:hypothetical protein